MPPTARCLILACGNTLRTDDGLGPWLANRAATYFADRDEVRILARQQWTPDLAEDLAQARAALFLDCSVASAPGEISLLPVEPSTMSALYGAHHLDAASLLALSRDLYGVFPARALQLTVGAGSLALGESFSPTVTAALAVLQARLIQSTEELLALA
jgi:hydrogenase maturation protease